MEMASAEVKPRLSPAMRRASRQSRAIAPQAQGEADIDEDNGTGAVMLREWIVEPEQARRQRQERKTGDGNGDRKAQPAECRPLIGMAACRPPLRDDEQQDGDGHPDHNDIVMLGLDADMQRVENEQRNQQGGEHGQPAPPQQGARIDQEEAAERSSKEENAEVVDGS